MLSAVKNSEEALACRRRPRPHAILGRRVSFRGAAVLLISAFQFFSLSAFSSTVTGLVQTAASQGYKTNLLFTPLSTPLTSGNNLIASATTNIVTDSNGAFSIGLLAGDYLVNLGNLRRDSFYLSVPNDTNTYNFISLITNALVYTFLTNNLPPILGGADRIAILGGAGTTNVLTSPWLVGNPRVTSLSQLSLDNASSLFINGHATDPTQSSYIYTGNSNSFFLMAHGSAIYDTAQVQQWLFNNPAAGPNNVARLSEVTNAANNAVNSATNTAVTLANSAVTNATAISSNNVLGQAGWDTNGIAYINALRLGQIDAGRRQRILSGFLEFSKSGLWTNLVDAAVLGTNMNTAGATFRTFRLRYGTNVNSPNSLDYGQQYAATSSQYSYIRGLPDCRTNTMLVIIDKASGIDAPIMGLAPATADGDHTMEIFADEAGGTDSILSYYRDGFGAGHYAQFSITNLSLQKLQPTNDEEHCICITSSNGTFSCFTDGFGLANTNSTNWTFASPYVDVVIGGGRENPNPQFYWTGVIKAFAIFNKPLNKSEIRAAMKAFRWFDMREQNYLVAGDSTSCWLNQKPHDNWPWQLFQGRGWSNQVYYRNMGFNGSAANGWNASGYYNEYCAQFAPGGPVTKGVAIVKLGINDLLGGLSASLAFEAVSNLCNTFTTNGWEVRTMTIAPATNYLGTEYTAAHEVNRLGFNSLLLTSAIARVVYRLDWLFPNMDVATSSDSLDGLHPTYTANSKTARMISGDDGLPIGLANYPNANLSVGGNSITAGKFFGDVLALMPLGSTTTNSAGATFWNSNNAAIFIRGTNGTDHFITAM